MIQRHYFLCILCITASLLAGCRDVFTGAWDDIHKPNSGIALWAKTLSYASDSSTYNRVAVDSDGNIYAVGYVTGTGSFSFGGNSTPFNGLNQYYTAVIVKYNTEGTVQWATPISAASNSSSFSGVAVDSAGNAYTVGSVNGTGSFSFGGSSTPFNGAYSFSNAVIVKYNASGTAQWATPISAASNESRFSSVAVDSSGNTYAVGNVYGTGSFNFGGNSAPFSGAFSSNNAVIVKYNASGTAQWATPIISASEGSSFSNVAIDNIGNTYAVGTVQDIGLFNFGGASESFNGLNQNANAVIVKYNGSGTAQWVKTLSSASDTSSFTSVAVDSECNIYTVGFVDGTGVFNFGGNSTSFNGATSSMNAIIIKYNSSGTAQWATPISSASHSSLFYSVAVDSTGNTYTVGTVDGTGSFNFGGNSAPFSGAFSSNNAVIVKYNASGTAQWATPIISAPAQSSFGGVAVDGAGYIYAAGYVYSNTQPFNFGGNNVSVTGASSEFNAVIVKYY
jgi:Beta-propeller repeat